VVQRVLGALYLFAPQFFIAWQGLSEIGQDINYPLVMLAGRFIVYGVGMFVIASDPVRYKVWADGMIAIQAIDLVVGLFCGPGKARKPDAAMVVDHFTLAGFVAPVVDGYLKGGWAAVSAYVSG